MAFLFKQSGQGEHLFLKRRKRLFPGIIVITTRTNSFSSLLSQGQLGQADCDFYKFFFSGLSWVRSFN